MLPGAARAVTRRTLHSSFSATFAPTSSTSFTPSAKLRPVEHEEDYSGRNIYKETGHGHYPLMKGVPHGEHPYRLKPLQPAWRSPVCPITTANYNRTILYPRDTQRNFLKRYSTVAAPSTSQAGGKKVAVVLSGCGVYDGSEIHEAVSVLVHLSRAGVDARCFAPDIPQSDVVNHVKGSPSSEGPRNVLTESARIARGKIKPLSTLQTETYSAVIFPGGYGAAKNLCTFAKQGEEHSIQADVQRVLKEFHDAKKPIGMLCVSPVIIAKLIPGVTVTLGNEDKDIEKAIEKMGSKSIPLGVLEVAVDNEHNVITSPAYMTNSPIHKVFDGIGKFVEILLSKTQPLEEKEKKA